jgi:hypothetical protein
MTSRIESVMHVKNFEMKFSCLLESMSVESLEAESLEAESVDAESESNESLDAESIDAGKTKDRRDSMLMTRHE